MESIAYSIVVLQWEMRHMTFGVPLALYPDPLDMNLSRL